MVLTSHVVTSVGLLSRNPTMRTRFGLLPKKDRRGFLSFALLLFCFVRSVLSLCLSFSSFCPACSSLYTGKPRVHHNVAGRTCTASTFCANHESDLNWIEPTSSPAIVNTAVLIFDITSVQSLQIYLFVPSEGKHHAVSWYR